MLTKLGHLARIWWFGPLSGGSIGIGENFRYGELDYHQMLFILGLTNCVGISLSLLFYFSSLSTFSLNLIIVIFCATMLLMTNLMLLYGSVQKKPHLLLPWLVTNTLATLGLLVYTAIKWTELDQFKVIILVFVTHIFIAKHPFIPGSHCGRGHLLCLLLCRGGQLLPRAGGSQGLGCQGGGGGGGR